jgi:hypothetical protein
MTIVFRSLSAQLSKELPAIGVNSRLCYKLSQVRRMPFETEPVDDPLYYEFVNAGSKAVPCLVTELTDTRRMHDPRTEPVVQNFRVGDLAFFLLSIITGADYSQVVPNSVLKDDATKGIYSYFDFVKNPANRRLIQARWCAWIAKNVPSETVGVCLPEHR